jgi:thiol:disulfide interchange protein DsbD
VLLTPACSRAEEPPAPHHPEPVRAELITEHASIQPGGATRVGVHFEIEEGWHIYADPPGDAGLPTKVAWSAPFGSFGPLQWPPPHEFLDPGNIRTSGYAGVLVLISRYAIPAVWTKSPPNPIPLSAKVSWLACRDICIPGSARLELSLPISDQPPAFSTHAQMFEQTN